MNLEYEMSHQTMAMSHQNVTNIWYYGNVTSIYGNVTSICGNVTSMTMKFLMSHPRDHTNWKVPNNIL